MKGSVDGLVKALIADDVDSFVQDLFWKIRHGSLNLGVDVEGLLFPHCLVGHPAGGAVDVIEHFLALVMDQVSALHGYVSLGRVHHLLHTDWAV